MDDSSKENPFQLLKRFGAYLTVKISNVFSISPNNLNSRSIGTVAGLAIVVVLTWRLFRTPTGHRRRQPKPQAPTPGDLSVSAHLNPSVVSSGVSSSSEDSRALVLDESFEPSTLAQRVRINLRDGRKVTCQLLGIILEESTPEELQKQATVRLSVLEVLLEMTKHCDVYLMERILDDESGEKVLLALEEAGVFTCGGLVKDKVLFCSTEKGRSSFVRQLEPDWHIDTNSEIISQLARFIKYQLHITQNRVERTASNVFSSPSLEQFLGFLNRN